jgi:hypothetical protein
VKRVAAAALVLALFGVARPAHAQAPEIVRDMAGPYQIVPTDGSAACGIQLTAEPLEQFWRARPDPGCAARLSISGVAAWEPSDGIILRDGKGKPAMSFVEDETGLPSSPDLQAPRYYLVPRIAGYTHLPQPSELVGHWVLRSRGRPPCLLTFTATPAFSSAPRRGVTLGKGCAGKPLPARLTRWSMEDMKIMLWGPGDELLALEPVGNNRYVAEPGAWVLSQ